MSGKHNSINYYKPSNNMGGRATSTIRLAAQHRSNTASAAAIERVQPRRRLSIAQDQLVRSRQNNRNVNEYGWQHGNRNMSISDDEDDALDLSPMCSPTAWIMQVGKECGSNASSVLSSISSMHSPNTNNNDDKYNYNVRKPGRNINMNIYIYIFNKLLPHSHHNIQKYISNNNTHISDDSNSIQYNFMQQTTQRIRRNGDRTQCRKC